MVKDSDGHDESEASKALALQIYEENKQLRDKLVQQETVIAELQKRKARSAAESARQQQHKHVEPPGETISTASTSGATTTVQIEAEPPHFVGPWQRHCPNCGKENEHFKDEVVCDPEVGGCGQHVGAYEAAKKYLKCPNCGKEKGNDEKPLMKYIGADPKIIQEIDKIVSGAKA